MAQLIDKEIMDLQNNIRELELKLKTLNDEKTIIISEDNLEVDLEILTDEIIELELKISSEKTRYNNLLQLRDYQLSCNHSFIEDLIDITPEKSKTIKYCTVCLFTCENYSY